MLDLLVGSWLVWIVAGVCIHFALPWKKFLPALLSEVTTYGKQRDGIQHYELLTVPKRWFTHFYAWGLLWNAWLLCLSLGVCNGHWAVLSLCEWILPRSWLDSVQSGPCSVRQLEVVMAMVMVFLQIGRRLYECLFVSVFSDARMHLMHYVLGLYFYTAIGPTIFYHFDNGTSGSEVSTDSNSSLSCLIPLLTSHWRVYHIIAAALFVWGWRHQFRCMVILGLLRDQQPTKPVGSQRHQSSYAYRIPHGDWFEIVSSPHYLAEVIIYTAVFLVMGGKNHYWLLVVLFVITILSVSARQTHAWYKRTFRGYPAERYVIFPRIY